ncbi:MAG TPA: hypothetical protein DEP48_04900 [Persephonella sp.]|uniref:hypothetical protein n=1 Tax=Persephonella TaxID=182899 RepID=UPI0005A0BB21|nr:MULTISPECIES: hypothetical protein [Persephonella]HCB69676.1 hypothetical protein [Persephonella sp.]
MRKLILILALSIGLVYIPSDKGGTGYREVSDQELDSISGRGFITGGKIIIDFGSKKVILWDEIELGTKGGNK